MSISFDITREELVKIISQLDQAIYYHQQWHTALIRTLVCRLHPDHHDLNPNACHECRFGQWYYNETNKFLREHPGFKELGEEHFRMHQLATRLLHLSQNHLPITVHDYDSFSNSIERMRLEIYALKREIEEILYNRDPLTGTINKINALPILREYHELAKRKEHSYCLAMMDLDHFKEHNDGFGHAAGDRILAATAHYMLKNLRSFDKIFRYGGDEFLICLQDSGLEEAMKLIERIRKGLEEQDIDIGNGKTLKITASFGLSILDPFLTIEQSIDNSDKALYIAKTEGRNCCRAWAAEPIVS